MSSNDAINRILPLVGLGLSNSYLGHSCIINTMLVNSPDDTIWVQHSLVGGGGEKEGRWSLEFSQAGISERSRIGNV